MKIAVASMLFLTGCATATDFTPASAPGVKRLPADVRRNAPAVPRHRPPSLRATRATQRRSVAHNWDAVAACESSGDWHINTGNSYFGGLQMNAAFWANYGGLSYAPRPDLATKAQQTEVAERGLAAQGINSWPTCGWRLAS